jgi:hypothetical protein
MQILFILSLHRIYILVLVEIGKERDLSCPCRGKPAKSCHINKT